MAVSISGYFSCLSYLTKKSNNGNMVLSPEQNDNKQGSGQYIFSQETVDALNDLGHVLRRIYKRMRSEGITIEKSSFYTHHESVDRENRTGHMEGN
jgi:hypothetical protein